MPVRTVIERGPKGKRSGAFGIDWPGWSRGARSAELARETLESYRERYRPVAGLAGMAAEFDAAGPLEIVEDKVGTGSTDFWGISFSPSATEQEPMGEAELERGITLLEACWAFFDGVAARVSPEMRKGPRGGGRGAHPRWAAPASGGLRRGDARLQRREGHAAHAVLDAAVPRPTLCLPHPRPCLGDGGQGPLRPGRGLRARLRRRAIGYVFQDFNLLAGLSAVENVALPLELDGVGQRAARASGLAALDELGLADQAGRFPDELSGGERQRVAIARAVVGERRLLLADEPTGALDSVNGESVMRLLRDACKRGVAGVMVTHDAHLASWADRVVFLRDGRMVDQTTKPPGPESLLTPRSHQ